MLIVSVLIQDSGLLDIYVGSQNKDADDGLDVTLTVENAGDEDEESFFVLKKVQVAMTGFDICIHGSQHPLTNWLARGSLRGYLEVQLISAVSFLACPPYIFQHADKPLRIIHSLKNKSVNCSSLPTLLFTPSNSEQSELDELHRTQHPTWKHSSSPLHHLGLPWK